MPLIESAKDNNLFNCITQNATVKRQHKQYTQRIVKDNGLEVHFYLFEQKVFFLTLLIIKKS